LVRDLTGAEDVVLVNNNAGATFLVLAALARGREAVISRGELIEIGGSFRLPDIMREAGVVLKEVGTTNKTHLKDYQAAVGPQTAMILKVHKSNYKIVGFTKEVAITDLAKLGKEKGVPVVDDLGCGALVGLEAYGHGARVHDSGEPRGRLRRGALQHRQADRGPQGGMVVGKKALLDKIRSHPLYRVLRVCKLTLGAAEATLRLFKAPDTLASRHPVYAMISKTPADMERQAGELRRMILEKRPAWEVSVAEETSFLGGGSLPETEMPSFAVRIKSPTLEAGDMARLFRKASTPVIPRVADGACILDMRTVSRRTGDDRGEPSERGEIAALMRGSSRAARSDASDSFRI